MPLRYFSQHQTLSARIHWSCLKPVWRIADSGKSVIRHTQARFKLCSDNRTERAAEVAFSVAILGALAFSSVAKSAPPPEPGLARYLFHHCRPRSGGPLWSLRRAVPRVTKAKTI